MVAETFVPLCFADDAPVYPKSKRVESFAFGVIEQVVEGSDHEFCDFFMAAL